MLEYKQPIPKTVPDTKISYSDHEAVAAKILIQSRSKSTDTTDSCPAKSEQVTEKSYADTLGEGIEVLDQILKRLRTDKSAYFVSFPIIHSNSFTKQFREFTKNQISFKLISFVSGHGFPSDHSLVFPD